jgi:hypothetical protein
VHESAIGTKRTSTCALHMSAFGVKRTWRTVSVLLIKRRLAALDLALDSGKHCATSRCQRRIGGPTDASASDPPSQPSPSI